MIDVDVLSYVVKVGRSRVHEGEGPGERRAVGFFRLILCSSVLSDPGVSLVYCQIMLRALTSLSARTKLGRREISAPMLNEGPFRYLELLFVFVSSKQYADATLGKIG